MEKFFLYNNNSRDNYLKVLKPYIEKGIVDLIDWPQFPAAKGAFMNCVVKQEYYVKWIAFINTDEFLFSPVTDRLQEVLADYKDYPAIGVHWQIFGSSGHIKKPKGFQITTYNERAKKEHWANEAIKSIVNPRKVLECLNTHPFKYIDGYCVNENKKRVGDNKRYKLPESFSRPVSISRLRINHYITRSKEECFRKIQQRIEIGRKDKVSNFNLYWKWFNRNDVKDTTILRFTQRLKARLRVEQ